MGLWQRIANTFKRRRLHDDIADELAFHVEQREQANQERGMTPSEAILAARRSFGNVTLVNERTADSDLLNWLGSLARDSRLAVRLLWRSPVYTGSAVLTLALGIGANTAVFTLMKLIVMDALPVRQPEQLVVLHDSGHKLGGYGNRMGNPMSSAFSYPLYRDLNSETADIFSGVLARAQGRFTSVNLTTAGNTDRIAAELVSGNYFSLLGVSAWRGRVLTETDDEPRSSAAVVLSYGFWQRQFAGDLSVLNRSIRLNDRPFVVIGIAPPGFHGINLESTTDAYVPVAMVHRLQATADEDPLPDRNYAWLSLIARLEPGVTIEQAQSALGVIYPALRDKQLAYVPSPSHESLENFRRQHIELTPGGQGYSELREELEKPLQYVFAMTRIFLLITLVNIANLLIARAWRRSREMAVRLSLGAPRSALVRQLLIESCLLAAIGGASAILLAYLGTPFLLKRFSADLSEAGMHGHPEGSVLGLSLFLSLLCGVLFGLAPAWQSARTKVAENLKREGGTHTSGGQWGRRTLIAGQVALSFVLLASALLFTVSLQNLRHIDVGFRTDHLICFKLDPSSAGYTRQLAAQFSGTVLQQTGRLRGVESAALAGVPVMENSDASYRISVEGYQPVTSADAHSRGDPVSSSFFATMQLPFVAGRAFSEAEVQRAYKVAVVNQTFVRHFCSGRNPVGVNFSLGGKAHNQPWTIVGVVHDSEYLNLRGNIEPLIYLPYTESGDLHEMTFYLRTKGAERAVIPEVRKTVHQIDPRVPVSAVTTISELIDGELFAERGLSLAAGVFAVLACALAAVGLYGVMAYMVAQRRREFGIRLAIGSTPHGIALLVLREAGAIGIAGLLLGIPCAYAGGKWGQQALYGLKSMQVGLWVAAALGILLVIILTASIPARVAARMNPQNALKDE